MCVHIRWFVHVFVCTYVLSILIVVQNKNVMLLSHPQTFYGCQFTSHQSSVNNNNSLSLILLVSWILNKKIKKYYVFLSRLSLLHEELI